MSKLSVNQTHAINDHVLRFRFPQPVRFMTPAGVVYRTLDIQKQSEDFYVALPAAPQQVRVDPGLTVLVKMRVDLPTDLLYAQLEDPGDMLERLLPQPCSRRGHRSHARAGGSGVHSRAAGDPHHPENGLHHSRFRQRASRIGLAGLQRSRPGQRADDSCRESQPSQRNHRLATIEALGVLRDPKSLAKIKPFTRTTQDSPVRRAAQSAVSALRAGRRPADGLRELRDEVHSLRQENRELKSGLNDLKQQFEEGHRPEAQ